MKDRVDILLELIKMNFCGTGSNLPMWADVRKITDDSLKEYFDLADRIMRMDLESPTPAAKPRH